MASARQRDGRWTGLYRDGQGRQRSAGTYGTKASALKAARAYEAVEATGRDARQVLDGPELLSPSGKKGKPTVAGYAPTWLAGHRLEATSRATYAAMLLHIDRELGGVTLDSLDAPKVRSRVQHEVRMLIYHFGHLTDCDLTTLLWNKRQPDCEV